MGFTCNSEARWESWPSDRRFFEGARLRQEPKAHGAAHKVRFLPGKSFETHVPASAVTHLRFHRHRLRPSLSPPLLLSPSPHPSPLRRRRLPLNVRQVIYTRGFTARKILRKAVTRAETGATQPSRREKTTRGSENEKPFLMARDVRATSTRETRLVANTLVKRFIQFLSLQSSGIRFFMSVLWSMKRTEVRGLRISNSHDMQL